MPKIFRRISLNRGKSHIDSPKWLENEKVTTNLKNNDVKSFQYAVTAALNHEKMKSNPERILNIKPFIDQYELEINKLSIK